MRRLKQRAELPRLGTLRGVTMIELLIACAVVALLAAALLLPALSRPRKGAKRIACVSNLKQVTLAFRMWANDYNGAFPFALSTNVSRKLSRTSGHTIEFSGTREYIEKGEIWRHFATMERELNTPKVLVCPTDPNKTRRMSWKDFNSNAGLSYFVGFDASEINPASLLTGDRNLTVPIDATTRVARLTAGTPVAWGRGIHNQAGNIGFGDGSVNQMQLRSLQDAVSAAVIVSTGMVRLGIP